jgi:formylglycine-generating enzyme required for sulfatase activity
VYAPYEEQAVDPLGKRGTAAVHRGGSWRSRPESARLAARGKVSTPYSSASTRGFRLVRSVH